MVWFAKPWMTFGSRAFDSSRLRRDRLTILHGPAEQSPISWMKRRPSRFKQRRLSPMSGMAAHGAYGKTQRCTRCGVGTSEPPYILPLWLNGRAGVL